MLPDCRLLESAASLSVWRRDMTSYQQGGHDSVRLAEAHLGGSWIRGLAPEINS